jgi:hypothetical protein
MIDALDECSDPKTLMSHLTKISESAGEDLKIFVTSRMIDSVSASFTNCAIISPLEHTSADIDNYVLNEIKHRETGRLLEGTDTARSECEELEDRLMKILVQRAQGM